MLRLVEGRRGRFLADSSDSYVGRSLIKYGEYNEEQAAFLCDHIKEGDIVADVGANIGAHTVAMASKAQRVIAFEPQRRIYNILCANVALNELDRSVRPMRLAVGEQRVAEYEIDVLDYMNEDNNYGAFSMETKVGGDVVGIVPLEQPVSLIKIDVQGWELKVLIGAQAMIRRNRPIIYCENDQPENSDSLLSLLRDAGYRCYWHITPLFTDQNFRGETENIYGREHSFDMICYPDKRDCPLAEVKYGKHPLKNDHTN